MDQDGGMTLTAIERDYLNTQALGRLATVDKDGMPQNNPVGFSYDEDTGTIDIGCRSMGATCTFANVANRGVTALVVDDVVSQDPRSCSRMAG
jgi:pyridoxamine 5'-phosphate oxidase family protein